MCNQNAEEMRKAFFSIFLLYACHTQGKKKGRAYRKKSAFHAQEEEKRKGI